MEEQHCILAFRETRTERQQIGLWRMVKPASFIDGRFGKEKQRCHKVGLLPCSDASRENSWGRRVCNILLCPAAFTLEEGEEYSLQPFACSLRHGRRQIGLESCTLDQIENSTLLHSRESKLPLGVEQNICKIWATSLKCAYWFIPLKAKSKRMAKAK